MKRLLTFAIFLCPVFAWAQKEIFLREYGEVNGFFFSQQRAVAEQTFRYYQGPVTNVALDSVICVLAKNGTTVGYSIGELESFSGDGYVLKISHPDKTIYLAARKRADTTQLKNLLAAGFSGFSTFAKIKQADQVVTWELGGGSLGIVSAKMMLDLSHHAIRSLEIRLTPNHPLVKAYLQPGQEIIGELVIRVSYHYPDTQTYPFKTLRDFITVNGQEISPSERRKEYKIVSLTATN